MATPRLVTAFLKKKIAANARWQCADCRVLVDHLYQIDHIKPLYAGGTNNKDNLQLLCHTCHALKTWDEAHDRQVRQITQAEAAAASTSYARCRKCRIVYSKYFSHMCAPAMEHR